MTDLMNCPFCGSGIDNSHPVPFPTFHNGVRWWVARCGNPDCAAQIEAGSAKLATERWNRRAPVQASEARGDWVLVPRDLLLTNAKRLRYRATETCGFGPDATDAGAQMVATAEALEDMAAHTQAGPVD